MSLRHAWPVALSMLTVLPSTVRAQEIDLDGLESDYSVERFRLASDRSGVLDVESGRVLGHLGVDIALWLGYSDDPLNLYRDSEIERERIASLVSHRLGGNLAVAVGLFDRLQIAASLPLILSQDQSTSGLAGSMSLSSFGLGDIHLAPKLQILTAADAGFEMAAMVRFGLPTNKGEDYFGESGPTLAPELAASMQLTAKLRGAVNVGWLIREQSEVLDLEVNDELYAHLGVGYQVHPRVELDATIATATAPGDLFGAFNRNFSELRGGVAVELGEVILFAAAGAGTSQGFGTPDWRMLAGARFAAALPGARAAPMRRIARPESGAGADIADRSRADSDRDGVVDFSDRCPLVFASTRDGCPGDPPGFVDAPRVDLRDGLDAGPASEDVDPGVGLADRTRADSDRDGIVDASDRCPMVFASTRDGCPGPPPSLDGSSRRPKQNDDRDGDGIDDAVDNCPDEAGTADNHGCNEEQLVRLTDAGIELLEKVSFESDKSTIRPRSYRLLRNVAAVLNAHPELHRIRVEGHTDDQGGARYNLSLSTRRADAVRNFLIAAEVPEERLDAVGRGEETPVADNKTAQGRAENRRVEFVRVDE